MALSWLRRLASSQIRSEAELTSYVVRTTVLCVAAALAFDVANQMVFFESWSIALRSWAVTIGIVIVIATPVTRTIGKANLALFRASRTDPLTGLLNRRALFEGVADPGALMVLMIADVDRFKSVNDTHGHMAGDAVLFTIADLLKRELGSLGRVGRLGGEEFALLCGSQDGAALMERLERFRITVAETPVVAGAAAVSVTLSAGVAHRDHGQSFEQLYAEADRALYRAKAQGRNRIVVAGRAAEAAADEVRGARARERAMGAMP